MAAAVTYIYSISKPSGAIMDVWVGWGFAVSWAGIKTEQHMILILDLDCHLGFSNLQLCPDFGIVESLHLC